MLHVRRSSLRTPLHIQGWWSVVPRVAKKAFLHSESAPRMRARSIWVKHSSFWRSLSAHCASSELQHLVTIVFNRSLINERKLVLAASLCGNVRRIPTAHSSSLTSSDFCFNDNSTLRLILNLSWVYNTCFSDHKHGWGWVLIKISSFPLSMLKRSLEMRSLACNYTNPVTSQYDRTRYNI